MRPVLADVVVRARGIATHLLDEEALRRLARSSGSAVLSGAVQSLGYLPAPSLGTPARSVVETIDAAIEHGFSLRLQLLERWLADRREAFAGVFEYEARRALRFWLRGLRAGEPARAAAPGAWALHRRLREALAAAADAPSFLAALHRFRSPYAGPMAAAWSEAGGDLRALERGLDRTFAARARRAAARQGGRLLSWVCDGIDLENAWDALAGGDSFVEGGRALARDRHAAVAAAPTGAERRNRLERAFADTPLARVFADADLPDAALEARARAVRARNERRAARIDPLGAAPILELVMRLREERAVLRRINWGIAQGLPVEMLLDRVARRA